MQLLQWNIQWCRGVDGVVDAARIARVARELCDPDVCCFQEVADNFGTLAGSSGEDQLAALAARFAGYSAHFAWGVDVPDARGARRRFGNLILSRLPVRQVFRHALPWPSEDGVPAMPRCAVEAVVESDVGPVRVLSTHLEFYSAAQRAAQIERLRELHAEACAHSRARPSVSYDSGPFQPFQRPPSTLVAGDFNLPPQDPLHARMQAPIAEGVPRFADAWTARHPGQPHPPTFCLFDRKDGTAPYCCDFVFVSEDLLPRLRETRVDGVTQASDHQPVIVSLD